MSNPIGQRLPLNALLNKPLRDRPRTPSPESHATTVSLYTDRVAQATRNDTEKLSAVVNAVIPPGEQTDDPVGQTVLPPPAP